MSDHPPHRRRDFSLFFFQQEGQRSHLRFTTLGAIAFVLLILIPIIAMLILFFINSRTPFPDAAVLLVTNAIVGAKAVRMNRCREFHSPANDGLQPGFCAVWHDLSVHAPIALIDTKDDGLAACAAPALAPDTARAEVTLIEFNLAGERRLSLAMLDDGLANQSQITVDRVAIQTG